MEITDDFASAVLWCFDSRGRLGLPAVENRPSIWGESPPKFITKPSRLYLKVGQTGKFSVKITGRPQPQIQWFKVKAQNPLSQPNLRLKRKTHSIQFLSGRAVAGWWWAPEFRSLQHVWEVGAALPRDPPCTCRWCWDVHLPAGQQCGQSLCYNRTHCSRYKHFCNWSSPSAGWNHYGITLNVRSKAKLHICEVSF